ncbi:hypothetical protein DPSP01_014672, partial [Paraphaeosphaeria sporulosa]
MACSYPKRSKEWVYSSHEEKQDKPFTISTEPSFRESDTKDDSFTSFIVSNAMSLTSEPPNATTKLNNSCELQQNPAETITSRRFVQSVASGTWHDGNTISFDHRNQYVPQHAFGFSAWDHGTGQEWVWHQYPDTMMTDVKKPDPRINDLAPESSVSTRVCPVAYADALSGHRRVTYWGPAVNGQRPLPSTGFKNGPALYLENDSTSNTQHVQRGPISKEKCTGRIKQEIASGMQDLILTDASATLSAGLSREGHLCASTGADNFFDTLPGGANSWVPQHLDQRPAPSIREHNTLATVERAEQFRGLAALPSLELNHQSKSHFDYQGNWEAQCPQTIAEAVLCLYAGSTSTLRLPVLNPPLQEACPLSYYAETKPDLMIPPWPSTEHPGPHAPVAFNPVIPHAPSELPVKGLSVQSSIMPSSGVQWTGYEQPLSILSSLQRQIDLEGSSVTTHVVPNDSWNAYVSRCYMVHSAPYAGNICMQVASPQEGSFQNRICPSLMPRLDEDVEGAARLTYVGSTGETIVKNSLQYCCELDQSKRYRNLRPTGEVQSGA